MKSQLITGATLTVFLSSATLTANGFWATDTSSREKTPQLTPQSAPVTDTETNQNGRNTDGAKDALKRAENTIDKSPPLGSFPKQLLKNFAGLVALSNLKPLVIGSAATAIAAPFDDQLERYFADDRQIRWLGESGHFLGNAATIAAISSGLLATSYMSQKHRLRSTAFSLCQGLVLDQVIAQSIKAATSRERPNNDNNRSFPSGHTTDSFMAARVLSHYYPKTTIPAYIMAGFMGFSRIEKNKHHLSDVVAGATLGYIVGKTVIRGTDLNSRARRITLFPSISADQFSVVLWVPF